MIVEIFVCEPQVTFSRKVMPVLSVQLPRSTQAFFKQAVMVALLSSTIYLFILLFKFRIFRVAQICETFKVFYGLESHHNIQAHAKS